MNINISSSENTFECFNIDKDELSSKEATVAEKLLKEEITTFSELGKEMQKTFTDNEILFLAVVNMHKDIQNIANKLNNPLDELLKQLGM